MNSSGVYVISFKWLPINKVYRVMYHGLKSREFVKQLESSGTTVIVFETEKEYNAQLEEYKRLAVDPINQKENA